MHPYKAVLHQIATQCILGYYLSAFLYIILSFLGERIFSDRRTSAIKGYRSGLSKPWHVCWRQHTRPFHLAPRESCLLNQAWHCQHFWSQWCRRRQGARFMAHYHLPGLHIQPGKYRWLPNSWDAGSAAEFSLLQGCLVKCIPSSCYLLLFVAHQYFHG